MMDVLDFIVNFSLNDVLPGWDAIIMFILFEIIIFLVALFIWLTYTKRGKQYDEYLKSLPEDEEKELNQWMPTESTFKSYSERNKLHKLKLEEEEERIKKLFRAQREE